MGSLERVPCIQVDARNVTVIWPTLVKALQESSYVALDLELSGLGNKKNFGIKNLEERYQAFKDVANSRAILSLGISTFEHILVDVSESDVEAQLDVKEQVIEEDKISEDDLKSDADKNWSAEDLEAKQEDSSPWAFECTSFNILCKRIDIEYELESESKDFLIEHGFDFEAQEAFGLKYDASSRADQLPDGSQAHLQALFDLLIAIRKPIVFHNGFLDLLFLYQSYVADLPNSVQTLIADLLILFPSGIFDTKFICEAHLALSASFLEYIYFERQRLNIQRMADGLSYLYIHFDIEMLSKIERPWIEYNNLATKILEPKPSSIVLCEHYSLHGWCPQRTDCPKSHNIDLILDKECKKRGRGHRQSLAAKKRSRVYKTGAAPLTAIKLTRKGLAALSLYAQSLAAAAESSESSDQLTLDEVKLVGAEVTGTSKAGIHRSGYDAFMTGYILGCLTYLYCAAKPIAKLDGALDARDPNLKALANNLFLSGKTIPLKIRASSYSKPSKAVLIKCKEVRDRFAVEENNE